MYCGRAGSRLQLFAPSLVQEKGGWNCFPVCARVRFLPWVCTSAVMQCNVCMGHFISCSGVSSRKPNSVVVLMTFCMLLCSLSGCCCWHHLSTSEDYQKRGPSLLKIYNRQPNSSEQSRAWALGLLYICQCSKLVRVCYAKAFPSRSCVISCLLLWNLVIRPGKMECTLCTVERDAQ